MKLLFLGYSHIVRRRVLPAAVALAPVKGIAVASLSRSTDITFPEGVSREVYNDYETALVQSGADLVYVSTINSDHALWVEKALRRGLHVVVDKPAFSSLEETERLLELAQRRHCCLAESNVYAYHPQIDLMKQLFAQADDSPTRLTAVFAFPPLPADNFRYRKELMGGALWDLGPYAITPGRLFFEAEPEELICRAGAWGEEVEIAFTLLATYSHGRSLVGHFGFNSAYRNYLEVVGSQTAVQLDRVFTIPPDMENLIQVNQHNQQRAVAVPPADAFGLFLHAVIKGIDQADYATFGQTLLSDARVLARLRESCHL